METYVKQFLKNLLDNQEHLSVYIDSIYENQNEDELNEIFGYLRDEGYIACMYADNRAYNVMLTTKAKHLKSAELKLSDKEELHQLLNKTDEIEKLFHSSAGGFGNAEEINDVPQYQTWIQEITMYLQAIFDRTRDQYIWDTINSCKKSMNGLNDRKIFNENAARFKSIDKNIDKYYGDSEVKETGSVIRKTPLVFISHSSKDKEYVEQIVILLKEMGLKRDEVFCSSVPGYDIGLNSDILETIREKFNEHDLYVMFVHSANYYMSPVSLNEMGAAWALKTRCCSILLPGFEFTDMKGVVNSSRISIKMDVDFKETQNHLNQLYDELADYFGIPRDNSIIWEGARDNFIHKINAIQPVNNNVLSEAAISILTEAEKDTAGQVMIVKDLGGTYVQAGKTAINKAGIRREEAKATAAVKELLRNGFLSQSDAKGEIFQLTNDAYQYFDENLR